MSIFSWYVIQTYSGCEVKVKFLLEKRIIESNMSSSFGKILIPTEKIVELRNGRKYKSERKFFPGYILIQIGMNESAWYLVRNIPKVLGFVGGNFNKPLPISDLEIKNILCKMDESGDKPKPKVSFEAGELIRIIDGPFIDFNGTVEEVNYYKNRLRVAVLIFGRSTPVDLDFSQVEKE